MVWASTGFGCHGCCFDQPGKPCPPQKDDPAQHTYCSLCGATQVHLDLGSGHLFPYHRCALPPRLATITPDRVSFSRCLVLTAKLIGALPPMCCANVCLFVAMVWPDAVFRYNADLGPATIQFWYLRLGQNIV